MDRIKQAITELANEQLGRQFPDPITAAQALEHVDDKLAQAWTVTQLCKQPAQSLLIEIIDRQFSDDAARDLLAAILNALLPTPLANYAERVGAKVVDAFAQHIAQELADKAQAQYENYEPTDDEMARSSSYDRSVRAEYRSMARADAAAYRRGMDDPKW